MSEKSSRLMKRVSGFLLILSLLSAGYIMVNRLGLVESLNFGAGAYYYSDIPGFERFVDTGAYTSPIPMWGIIALFLIWGFIMYRFWLWTDRR